MRRSRGRTVRGALAALLADGRADAAEAVIDHLEGNRADWAKEAGVTGEDLAQWRGSVRTLRAVRTREAREAAVARAREGELAIRDTPRETWADAYERLGRDEALRASDPDRAKAYLDEARGIRRSEEIAARRQRRDEEKARADEEARAYRVGEAVDRARDEARRANEAYLSGAMLSAAASQEPGRFLAELSAAADAGDITLSQFDRLRRTFHETWMRKGMPEKAMNLLRILQREFYADKGYRLDDGRVAFDARAGRLAFGKDENGRPFEGEDIAYVNAEGKRDYLSPQDQLDLMNWAAELAEHDGEVVTADPVTGERLASPRAMSAAEAFQTVCSELRIRRRCEAAAPLVMRRAEEAVRAMGFFGAREEATRAEAFAREGEERAARTARRLGHAARGGAGRGEDDGRAEQGEEGDDGE